MITNPVAFKLHIHGKKNTFVGGLTYYLISFYLLYTLIDRGIKMITYD